jgi:hypothetical protein
VLRELVTVEIRASSWLYPHTARQTVANTWMRNDNENWMPLSASNRDDVLAGGFTGSPAYGLCAKWVMTVGPRSMDREQ